MTNHLAATALSFAAFVFAVVMALYARSLRETREQSSLLDWQMGLARKIGLGWLERFAQHPVSLRLQTWIAYALASIALIFTIWNAVKAIASQ
jgi:hypothetical protein